MLKKFQLFLLNCFLLFGSAVAMEWDQEKINPRLTVYAYPTGENAKELYEQMKDQPIIPKNLIVKVFGYKEDNENKPSLIKDMQQYFPLFNFNYIASIHAKENETLDEKNASYIFEKINKIKNDDHKDIIWSGVSIDTEPVFDHNNQINTISFNNKIIKLINEELNLPVFIYIAPSKLGNKENGMITKAPSDFRDLKDAILKHKGNSILMPVYPDVREDDIELSVEKLKEAKIPYQLIVDVAAEESNAFKERLKILKEKEWLGEKMTIYPFEAGKTLQQERMNLIKILSRL